MTDANTPILRKEYLNIIEQSVSRGILATYFCDGKIPLYYINDALTKILGYESTDEFRALFGGDITTAIHPEDLPALNSIRNEIINTHTDGKLQYRLLCKDGCYMSIFDKIRLLIDENNNQVLLGILSDVGEIIKSQKSPCICENEIQAAVEQSKLHTWELDLIKNIAFPGIRTREYYRSENKIEDFPIKWVENGCIHPDDGKTYIEFCRQLAKGLPFAEWDSRTMNYKTGKYEWRHISYTTVFDKDGRAVKALGSSEDINSVKEQENRFRTVLAICGFASWTYNIEHRCITKGTRLHELFGLSNELIENVPQSIIESGAIHPDDVQSYKEIYLKISNGASQASNEIRVKKLETGNYNWYKIHCTVITDDDGKPVHAIGCAVDINEQKEAKILFEAETHQLFEIQDENLLGKCRANITLDEIDNYSAVKGLIIDNSISAYSDIISNVSKLCATPQMANEFSTNLCPDAVLMRYYKGEVNYSIDYKRKMKNGQYCWVRTKVSTFEDPENGDVMCFMYTFDIDTEKLSQIALQSIVDQNYDFAGIADKHSGNHLCLIKGSDTDLFSETNNYDKSVLLYADKYHDAFVSEEDYTTVKECLLFESIEKAIDIEPRVEYHFRKKDENGNVHIFRAVFNFIDDEKTKLLFCRSDISNVVAKEEKQQKEMRDALRQAKVANAAKSNFLTRMSHDIRTPLNGIMGMTQLAYEETDLSEVKKLLDKINISSRFLLGLLNDILDMSKIESGKYELTFAPYRTTEFIDYVDAVIRPLCDSKNIELSVSFNTDYTIMTDKLRFNQIFFNLLANAAKFTHNGGKIEVYTENEDLKNGVFSADFIVKDNGIGMSRHFQSRMFEPFAQEKAGLTMSNEGTGLGLSIVKSFVDLFKGSIGVESSPGCGTKFTLHFDIKVCTQSELNNHTVSNAQLDEGVSKGKRVLVCEDHPVNAQITATLLSRKGFNVDIAENGKVGVERFENSEIGFYSLILMDIQMPIMNGLDTAKAIRTMNRDDAKTIPIVAMSANAFAENTEASLNAGMNVHLSKPVSAQLLYSTIAQLL